MSVADKYLHTIKRLLINFVVAFGYKQPVFNQAKKAARMIDKPLLNAGCGYAYIESSNINLDVVPRNVPNFICGDIQDLSMFEDKQFGAVYASHVLEHVENPDAALREFDRVAENVFIITPLPLWPTAWFGPGHKWVLWHTKKICRTPHFANVIAHRAKKLLLDLCQKMSVGGYTDGRGHRLGRCTGDQNVYEGCSNDRSSRGQS